MVHAGLAAAPYLLRQEHWERAGALLENAFLRDRSRATAAAVLPGLQAITAADQDPVAAGALAQVLALIDPAAAERQMRPVLEAAVARGNYRAASVAAGYLMDLCRGGGRLAEALALATQKADYTRRAGLGSWTQLADEVRRLQVLAAMGRADQVLAAVQRLREHMQALPAVSDQSETVTPWGVRETLLDTGRDAALQLSRWDEALELSAAAAASKQDRGAPAGEIARARFNDYYPLIRLGHTGEALALLLECRRAFEQARDIQGLGTVLMALADVENTRGHGEAAISLARDALRYCYLAGDVTAIAVSYHNLGNYLARHARQPAAALACRLAAALIRALARAEGADRSARAAADDLRAAGAGADPPTDVPGLCRQAGGIPGADLDRLLAALAPEPGAAQRVLGELLAQVRDLAAAPPAADPGT